MNYYEHHIGDYAEATAHLTFVEDAAYSRMIRKYYAQEKPLPADVKAVQRLIGARTKEEREAVEAVLAEFFERREDGWHNRRCDAEVARYQDKQAKAKRSAEARWNRGQPQSESNANASADAMRTHSEGNAHQAPSTKHQTPDLKPLSSGSITDSGSASEEPPLLPDHEDDHPTKVPLPTREEPPLSDDPAIQMAVHLRRQGVEVQFTHPAVQDWTKAEVPLAVLDAAVRTARERLGEKAKINGNYLVPIVADILNPPAKAEPKAPKSDDWAWKRSNQGIEAKGRELGMFARGGESYLDFAARIQAEIDKRKGAAA